MAVLVAMGYYFQSVKPYDEMMKEVEEYSHLISYGIMAVVAIVLAILIYKGVKKNSYNCFQVKS